MLLTQVNKEEAKHEKVFVAGARPAILWICGLGLLYNLVVYPILDIFFVMPPVDTNLLETTLYGMLGLAGIRGVEKLKGVARQS